MSAIRPAVPEEADALSVLALRSKAHWGYSDAEMAAFAPELALSAAAVTELRAHVAEERGHIVGFYTLRSPDADAAEAELVHLFVDPPCLGRGVGAALFRHACEQARAANVRRLVIESDPNAIGFYAAMGARLARLTPSRVAGRMLPVFTKPLDESGEADGR